MVGSIGHSYKDDVVLFYVDNRLRHRLGDIEVSRIVS